ncbi:MAG: BON domain-containing protein [Acidocella sp.]|nr:BON domain-containing protein [Acidocella sp.]
MNTGQELLETVRAALHSEPRIHPCGQIHLGLTNGELTMDGEVDHIAGKKLALEAVARIPGVDRIIDKLHVHPSSPMGDGELLNQVRDALAQEIALASCVIRVRGKGHVETVQDPAKADGEIEIRVDDGVVTLDGDVPGPGEKRIAGVLAWWVPGSRDVINGIGVTPPEQDSEAAVTDAVLQVLEKDPFINAESIHVYTRGRIVTLTGSVPRPAERKLAEDDAWYVFGVDQVVNQLGIH